MKRRKDELLSLKKKILGLELLIEMDVPRFGVVSLFLIILLILVLKKVKLYTNLNVGIQLVILFLIFVCVYLLSRLFKKILYKKIQKLYKEYEKLKGGGPQ